MDEITYNDNNIIVSIIIVTYNCAEVIEKCLLSCLQENKVEIIVIDNASKDNTIEIASSYTNAQLHVIINNVNVGFTQACNIGIAQAQGEYIFLLNPDTYLRTNSVSLLSDYLDNNPDVGAVAPCLYYPNGDFQNYTRRFPTISGLWVESFIPMRYWNKFKCYRNYTCQDIDFDRNQEVEQPAGAALMFRNQWILDETYFIYGSDVDLCKMIINDGFKIVQIAMAKVVHYQSKGGTENMNLRFFLDLDNYYGIYYFFKKWQNWLTALIYKNLFGCSLFIRTVISIFESPKQLEIRWKKFIYFLQNRNFKVLLDFRSKNCEV